MYEDSEGSLFSFRNLVGPPAEVFFCDLNADEISRCVHASN